MELSFATALPVTAAAQVRAALAEARDLLGTCTPLPALCEEVLRAWRGLPVATRRLRDADALLARIREWPGGMEALAEVMQDSEADDDARLLAGVLWARACPPDIAIPFPDTHLWFGDPDWLIVAMARMTLPDPDGQYLTLLKNLLWRFQGSSITRISDELPSPLPLLAFLKTLGEHVLPSDVFPVCVQLERVLHPDISPHRPLRQLHRLLDYLGLSAEDDVQSAYRQLAARLWPRATADNWPAWNWIARPGGPDMLPGALQAVATGECTLPRLWEIKHAPVSASPELDALLAAQPPALQMLTSWLRPDFGARSPFATALRWLRESNTTAAATAYARPDWWADWVENGHRHAETALGWLQNMALPEEDDDQRAAWLARYLLHDYAPRHIEGNLLLSRAARGDGVDDLLQRAAAGQLPAIRALALAPQLDERLLDLLHRLARTGNRPVCAAAREALAHAAQRLGLPGAEELEHQRLLSAAWEQGPLAGARVRVDWQHEQFRLRLSLHGGAVRLDALGPRGPVARIPAELRQSDAYQQAREAQRETQAQYRLFKTHLERQMLEGTPLTAGEFRYLLGNPVFAHLAERLLWQTADGEPFLWAGPERWETLHEVNLALDQLTPTITLVHPARLARGGVLSAWQARAADRRLTQPFKQLFREIYTAEGEFGTRCARFAERRLDPARAYALLRAAGFAPGDGVARREWAWTRGRPDDAETNFLTAHISWALVSSGRELFGPQRLSEVASGDIWFTCGYTPISLARVDPVVFSETLRAADLLTTRAAVGDAALTSRETLALRSLLVREMARSFRLTNVVAQEFGGYALVLGNRATYRVNLLSGTVLLEPEGRQILVPRRHARWQPVEDGDEMSAILTTLLDLAHDDEIADLTFLAQL